MGVLFGVALLHQKGYQASYGIAAGVFRLFIMSNRWDGVYCIFAGPTVLGIFSGEGEGKVMGNSCARQVP